MVQIVLKNTNKKENNNADKNDSWKGNDEVASFVKLNLLKRSRVQRIYTAYQQQPKKKK